MIYAIQKVRTDKAVGNGPFEGAVAGGVGHQELQISGFLRVAIMAASVLTATGASGEVGSTKAEEASRTSSEGPTSLISPRLIDSSRPDLRIQRVMVGAETIQAGQTLSILTEIRNATTAEVNNPVTVQVCNQMKSCRSCAVSTLPSNGDTAGCRLNFTTSPAMMKHNPLFWIATVDPTNQIDEWSDSNNSMESAPVFVVVPKAPPARSPEYETDEWVVFRNGKVVESGRKDFGPAGAPDDFVGDPDGSGPAPDDDHGDSQMANKQRTPDQQPEPVTEVHPQVREDARAAGPEGRIEVLIQAAHRDERYPQLPDLDSSLPRLSEKNADILTERMAIMEWVRNHRREALASLIEDITEAGGEVLEFYAIGYSFRADIPVRLLPRLARDERIRTIEPEDEETTPPNHDEVDDARDLINADEIFDTGATGAGWYIGLLDTGVRATHDLLSSPDRIRNFRDCIFGNSYCLDGGNANFDASDQCDHGTATAAIMSGNSNLGNAYRGVTEATIDSYDVYRDISCTLSSSATVKGFERSLAWGAKMIVVTTQSTQGHSGSLADNADDSFDAGSLVVAANGNSGPGSGTVAAPANAHKAIGVGDYEVTTLSDLSSQSRGPTGDDRLKPDVRFPTSSETASDGSDTALGTFGETSGATPYAGASGILLVDFAQSIGWDTSQPGRVYAMLIAFGDQEYNNLNNLRGAGDVVLQTSSNESWWRGTRSITDLDWDYVEFDVDPGASCIEAAIWWAEGITWHNDIDLYLYDPGGDQRHHSILADSVFETLDLKSNIEPGTWKLGIYGYQVRSSASPETVYHFIRVCD